LVRRDDQDLVPIHPTANRVDRPLARMAQDETTRPPRIVRIVFDDPSIRDRLFDILCTDPPTAQLFRVREGDDVRSTFDALADDSESP